MSGRGVVAAALVGLAACHAASLRPAPMIENRTADADRGPRGGSFAAHGPISERSVRELLSRRFAAQLADGTFVADYSGTTEDILDELATMGIDDLAELAALIPDDFEHGGAGEFILEDPANIPGLVRDFMMIHDAQRYFGVAWKNRWQSILPPNVSALKRYVRDFRPFFDAGVLTPQEVDDAPEPPRPTRPPRPPRHPRLPSPRPLTAP